MGLTCIGPESRNATNPSTIGGIRNDGTYIGCAQQTSKSKLSQAKSRMVGTRTFGKTKSSWQFFAVKSSSSSPGTSRPGTRLSDMGKSVGIPEEQLDFPTN